MLFYSYMSKNVETIVRTVGNSYTSKKVEWKSVCVGVGGPNRLWGRQLKPKLNKKETFRGFLRPFTFKEPQLRKSTIF